MDTSHARWVRSLFRHCRAPGTPRKSYGLVGRIARSGTSAFDHASLPGVCIVAAENAVCPWTNKQASFISYNSHAHLDSRERGDSSWNKCTRTGRSLGRRISDCPWRRVCGCVHPDERLVYAALKRNNLMRVRFTRHTCIAWGHVWGQRGGYCPLQPGIVNLTPSARNSEIAVQQVPGYLRTASLRGSGMSNKRGEFRRVLLSAFAVTALAACQSTPQTVLVDANTRDQTAATAFWMQADIPGTDPAH
jgi:hypothetical protein